MPHPAAAASTMHATGTAQGIYISYSSTYIRAVSMHAHDIMMQHASERVTQLIIYKHSCQFALMFSRRAGVEFIRYEGLSLIKIRSR